MGFFPSPSLPEVVHKQFVVVVLAVVGLAAAAVVAPELAVVGLAVAQLVFERGSEKKFFDKMPISTD